ncbi:MAG: PASTA domain-containing protein [Clostridiaceae bacterium]|nr:PASTA domain-containing protein [Clostridiaceae bacterium]
MDKKKNSSNSQNNIKKSNSRVGSKVKKNKSTKKNISNKNLLICIIIASIIFILLLLRLAFIQFIQGSELKESANRQQTTNRIISAKRGNIYDSTGKLLAASASVDTVTINPTRIKEENKEKVAKAFSDIFELNYDEVLEKVKSDNLIETIIKKVEQDKIDQLEDWMKTTKIYSGINIDEDIRRYYPYGVLASNLIGFCDTDNNGQEGIELKWNSVLSGTAGKITTITDAVSDLIPDKNESYVAAENGSNITLTIDANIQTIVEKYLEQACKENICKSGGSIIAMNPSNGDILAMATYPNYDLNSPRSPNSELATDWDKLSESEQMNSLYKMWRNKAVSDTYEPGSTFKIITAAVGLEENVVDTDTPNDFSCSGYELVNGIRINCWKNVTTHGSQSLRNALMNSCNPALMQLGKRIGASNLYRYYKAFGLFDKTGIATSGETNSFFWDPEDVGNVELATMSFGQRFRVTPIQLITAVSSVANDGVLVQPRLVKQIENPDTGATVSIDSKNVRQVISKETSNKLMDMLESVVTSGTGRYAQVKGYSIAGKTGTSEPDANENSIYVASFVGIAPVENPEIVVLVTLYDPKGASNQGGTIAAPVASQILTEVLPYLGVPSDDVTSEESNTITKKTLPDVRNKTIAEAKKIIESSGFSCRISGSDTSLIVTDQVPKPGASLITGASVNLYSSGNETRVSQEVPNIKGMTFAQARNALKAKNLNIQISGSGTVLSQDPMAGTSVEEGTVINVTLKQEIQDAH